MKYYLLALFLSINAHGALRMEHEFVMPFSLTNYPLKDFVKDYAEMMNLNVTYVSNTISAKDTVHLKFNSKIKKQDFKKVFYNVIDTYGITGIEDEAALWISSTRDIRFLATRFYTDDSFPKDSSYSTVMYQLKYPVSAEIARNLRPLMSRYGRVIDFSDARTILLNDKGDNVSRLIETIKFMDTEKAYQGLLNFKPKIDPNATHPLSEKLVELEIEKKILEKKLMELKEGSNQ